MLIQIKSRDGSVMHEVEANSVRAAVEIVVRERRNLSGANLYGANLYGAYLYGADLSGANLSRAYLYGADLSGADLSGADLYGADLSRADLSGADLSGANLSRANLSGADLSGADLSGANLYGADLSGADLSGAKNIPAIAIARTRILPAGSLIGFKKVFTPAGNGIVVLRVPDGAKRSSAFGRKCRAEYVEVIEAPKGAYTDEHGPRTEYRAGETVRPDSWDDDWQNECSHGIHFYITREEAEAH